METIRLPDSTAGREYVCEFTRNSDGYVWNGVSEWVALNTLTDAQLKTAIELVTSDPVVSQSGTHLRYEVTVPAGITVPCHVSAYLTSYTGGDEDWGAEYTPTTTSGGTTGDGAYTVIIQVGVENAFVRLTLGATSYTAFTDADGEASFSCDAGTWTVGITAPAYLAFTPTLLIVTDDTTQAYTLTPATSVSDTFAEASDLYDMFGESNVKEWANMQELPITDAEYTTEIARRIEAALVYGTDEVKEFLRNGPYEEEFVTVPTSINRATCYKAGAWLFEWRRDSEENDRYSRMEAKADTILEQIKRGARQFDSVQTIEGTRAPGVVK